MSRTWVTYSRLAGHNNTRPLGREETTKAAIHGIIFVSHDQPTLGIDEKAQLQPYRATSDWDGTFF